MIKEISGEATRPLRQKILRPTLTFEELNYDGDEDPKSVHFGYFEDDNIRAIATLYNSKTPALNQTKNMYRLRGMAVDEGLQGKGIGKKIIEKCVAYVRDQSGDLIWCDARVSAQNFYSKLGFEIFGEEYIVPGVGPHYLMYKVIDA